MEGREIERDEGRVRDRQRASDSEWAADDTLLSTHGRKLCRYDPYSTRKPGLRGAVSQARVPSSQRQSRES